jgi:hypothetical protein
VKSVLSAVAWAPVEPASLLGMSVESFLYWDDSDPLAVQIRFATGSEPTVWFVGRDMFVETLCTGGSGWIGGDARMLIVGGKLELHLKSPFGALVAHAEVKPVKTFIDRTAAIIHPGCEALILDLSDAKIAAWMSKQLP